MTKPQAARTRRPKSMTRATILAKAYDMYLERKLVHGDERLSAVLEELGYTTGAGYQIWPNQAAFRTDLQMYIVENLDYASLRIVAEEIAELQARNLPFEEYTLAAADLYVKAFLGREEFYLTLRFLAMGKERGDEITNAIREAYNLTEWEATDLLSRRLADFGKRIRDPYELSDLTTAITALLEGYALRARVQPERISENIDVGGVRHHVLSVAFLGLVEAFTEDIVPADR